MGRLGSSRRLIRRTLGWSTGRYRDARVYIPKPFARLTLLRRRCLPPPFCSTSPASAEAVTPDQAAEMLLTSAKTAFNAKDYTFAAGRFREFLAKYGNHKDAAAARYGLALSLIDGPEKDYKGAVEQLQPLIGAKDAPDYPFYVYYLGLAQRGEGVKALAQIAAKPQEAPQLTDFARGRFEEAAKQFAAAARRLR